jgi:hypothetical protein
LKTLFVVVLYAVGGVIATFAVPLLANLGGAVGALVAYGGKFRQVSGAHKVVAVALCAAGQSYIFLGWVAFVVAYTTVVIRHQPVMAWVVWIVAFLAASAPGRAASRASVEDDKEDPSLAEGVPHLALGISMWLDWPGFLVFAIWPEVMAKAWPWIPFVREAAGP